MWVKTEGKEEEKKGRKRERERETERLREIETEKTLGWVKDSGEVWKYKEYSLLVVVLFFVSYYYFVYLLRKWFVTSVLISKRLIFSKLVFKAL